MMKWRRRASYLGRFTLAHNGRRATVHNSPRALVRQSEANVTKLLKARQKCDDDDDDDDENAISKSLPLYAN